MRERERERVCKGLWRETQRDTPLTRPMSYSNWTPWTPTSNWRLFQNLLIFIYLNSVYRKCDVISQSYWVISHVSPNCYRVYIYPIKLGTRHESTLLTFGLPVKKWQVAYPGRGALARTIQFDLHFNSKILTNLTANWKTRGPTKLDYEIIDTVKHHCNSFIQTTIGIIVTLPHIPQLFLFSG